MFMAVDRMVHPVHVRRHKDRAKGCVQALWQGDVAIVEQGGSVEQHFEHDHGTSGGADQIDKADPVRWKTRRDGWANKIESIQRQNMVLMGQRDRVRESSTAKSYQDIQSMFGLSRQGWALLIGLLLELIPFSLNLILGYYSQQRHNAGASGKKSQGLRLVA